MKTTSGSLALVLAASFAATSLAGCGDDRWHPSESVLALDLDVVPWEADDVMWNAVDDPLAIEQSRLAAMAGDPQIIYSNFSDGTTTLKNGKDNATTNTSAICGTTDAGYPKWKGTEARAKTLQNQLQAMMKDFNVVLAAKRPAMGPYSMIMVGPQGNGCSVQGAGGVAPGLDCGNKNRSNICFDFSSSGSVVTMAQEIGHTFGLGHNDVACDVMGASYTKKSCTTGKWGYIDMEDKTIGGGSCTGSTQNSYQAMKKVLGDWPGGDHPDPTGDGSLCQDMTAPEVKFIAPLDGETVGDKETGNSFKVTAEPSDDCGRIKSVKISIPALGLEGTNDLPPWEWSIDGIDYTASLEIVLTVTDATDKTSESRIKVTVGKMPPGPSPPPGPGENPMTPPKGGCGCRVGAGDSPEGGAPVAVSLILLGLVGLGRRRRSSP